MTLAWPSARTLRAACVGIAAICAIAAAVPVLSPIGTAEAAPQKKQRLSATRYYSLAPFTMPLFDGEDVTEQLTLVVALELSDDEQREEIARLVPKIRDAMYRELFAMVTFRRKGAPIPEIDQFKSRLYRVVRLVAGEKRVKTLLIQQAFKRPAR